MGITYLQIYQDAFLNITIDENYFMFLTFGRPGNIMTLYSG